MCTSVSREGPRRPSDGETRVSPSLTHRPHAQECEPRGPAGGLLRARYSRGQPGRPALADSLTQAWAVLRGDRGFPRRRDSSSLPGVAGVQLARCELTFAGVSVGDLPSYIFNSLPPIFATNERTCILSQNIYILMTKENYLGV